MTWSFVLACAPSGSFATLLEFGTDDFEIETQV